MMSLHRTFWFLSVFLTKNGNFYVMDRKGLTRTRVKHHMCEQVAMARRVPSFSIKQNYCQLQRLFKSINGSIFR